MTSDHNGLCVRLNFPCFSLFSPKIPRGWQVQTLDCYVENINLLHSGQTFNPSPQKNNKTPQTNKLKKTQTPKQQTNNPQSTKQNKNGMSMTLQLNDFNWLWEKANYPWTSHTDYINGEFTWLSGARGTESFWNFRIHYESFSLATNSSWSLFSPVCSCQYEISESIMSHFH